MKKFFLINLLLHSILFYSQDLFLVHKTKVYKAENNQKLSVKQVKTLLANNPEALSLYTSGKSNEATGSIIAATGFLIGAGKSLFGRNVDYNNNLDPNDEKIPTKTLYYVTAGLIVVSIPFLIGNEKKIKKSIDAFKNQKNNNTTGKKYHSNIIIAPNRLGI